MPSLPLVGRDKGWGSPSPKLSRQKRIHMKRLNPGRIPIRIKRTGIASQAASLAARHALTQNVSPTRTNIISVHIERPDRTPRQTRLLPAFIAKMPRLRRLPQHQRPIKQQRPAISMPKPEFRMHENPKR